MIKCLILLEGHIQKPSEASSCDFNKLILAIGSHCCSWRIGANLGLYPEWIFHRDRATAWTQIPTSLINNLNINVLSETVLLTDLYD